MLAFSPLFMFAVIQVFIIGSQAHPQIQFGEIQEDISSELELLVKYIAPATNEDCEGGVILSGQCFLFSSEHEKLSWEDAREKCTSLNASLAVLSDPVAFMSYAAIHYRDTGFWLGASDIESEGSWVWLDGRPLGDQFPWHQGEPNNAFEKEDCLLLSSDVPCDRLQRYVCEKKGVRVCPVKGRSGDLFTENNRNCFHFSLDNQGPLLNWTAAKNECQKLGARNNRFGGLAELGNPNNLRSDYWLMETIARKGQWTWLGGHKTTPNDQWIWAYSGRSLPLDFPLWAPSEPNGDGRCAHGMHYGNRGRYYLNDHVCDHPKVYVCQMF